MDYATRRQPQKAAILACLVFFYASCVNASQHDCERELDSLFRQLASAPDEAASKPLERDIWLCWLSAGDDVSDALMAEAVERRRSYDFQGALEVLNELVKREPAYAEGWNQRAIVYFHLGRYEASLHDVAAALEREPRHFGALAGRGIIRLRQGNAALAYQNILAAMAIHPYIPERTLVPAFDFKAPDEEE